MSRNRGEGLEVFIEDNQKSMELTSSNKPISIKLTNHRVIRAYINKKKGTGFSQRPVLPSSPVKRTKTHVS